MDLSEFKSPSSGEPFSNNDRPVLDESDEEQKQEQIIQQGGPPDRQIEEIQNTTKKDFGKKERRNSFGHIGQKIEKKMSKLKKAHTLTL